MKAECGFAIMTYSQDVIEENALERFGPEYGDKDDRERMIATGLVNEDGEITPKGWDALSDDCDRLETNSLKWLRDTFTNAVDHGHDQYEDVIGNVTFDTDDETHAGLIDLAHEGMRHERIDMCDSSYGDLAATVWEGVSDLGCAVLGGHITFFGLDDEGQDAVEETLYWAAQRKKGIPRPTSTESDKVHGEGRS